MKQSKPVLYVVPMVHAVSEAHPIMPFLIKSNIVALDRAKFSAGYAKYWDYVDAELAKLTVEVVYFEGADKRSGLLSDLCEGVAHSAGEERFCLSALMLYVRGAKLRKTEGRHYETAGRIYDDVRRALAKVLNKRSGIKTEAHLKTYLDYLQQSFNASAAAHVLRDRNIAANIDSTITSGEIAVLYLGAGHEPKPAKPIVRHIYPKDKLNIFEECAVKPEKSTCDSEVNEWLKMLKFPEVIEQGLQNTSRAQLEKIVEDFLRLPKPRINRN